MPVFTLIQVVSCIVSYFFIVSRLEKTYKKTSFYKNKEVVPNVTIDFSVAHFWDLSAVGALDKVVMKFRREGKAVHLLGINDASATIIERLEVYDKPNSVELMSKH